MSRPHPTGSPITKKEKRCILNLYQSYVNDGKSIVDARTETARRLGFGVQSVKDSIKEMISEGNVQDNTINRLNPNAYEKLEEEEIDEIRRIIHTQMKACNEKRSSPDNQELRYPTLDSLYKVVMATNKYPNWSLSTFREILLAMDI